MRIKLLCVIDMQLYYDTAKDYTLLSNIINRVNSHINNGESHPTLFISTINNYCLYKCTSQVLAEPLQQILRRSSNVFWKVKNNDSAAREIIQFTQQIPFFLKKKYDGIDILISGCNTDYCIKDTCIDLAGNGFNVTIIDNCCKNWYDKRNNFSWIKPNILVERDS